MSTITVVAVRFGIGNAAQGPSAWACHLSAVAKRRMARVGMQPEGQSQRSEQHHRHGQVARGCCEGRCCRERRRCCTCQGDDAC